MRSAITTSIVVTLVLSNEEAEWLNKVMQNPLHPDTHPDDENALDKEMRRKFWEATKKPT